MKELPYFRFFPGDWLSDGKITLMTLKEQGALIRLLSYSWKMENCELPIDKSKLVSLSGLHSTNELDGVLTYFDKTESGYYSTLLKKEKERAFNWRIKSSEGGKKSAQLRKNTDKGGSTNVSTNSMSMNMTSEYEDFPPLPDSFNPEEEGELERVMQY
ncbi:MAG: DUF1376 domain-containing protein, partial [Fibrobacteres bacterium]|nr:DUF1376 domain-containing protein [Fibrobacterota bacterium]